MGKLSLSRTVCILFVFSAAMAIASPAQTFTTLVNFAQANGATPGAPLVQGSDGNFYGTTSGGGVNSSGTVFQMTPTGKLTTLYSFCSQTKCTDGDSPWAGLVLGTDGNFYGTTSGGGVNSSGTVFQITPAGKLTTLYSFCSQPNCTDGFSPYAGLVQASDGNFYGTTFDGYVCNGGCGTVFRITPEGKLTTLHRFNGTDGLNPDAPLVQGADGNFYGTTLNGEGSGGRTGSVFKMTPGGALTNLYSFCSESGCSDGAGPYAPLVQGADGNFYGTTSGGGSGEVSSCTQNGGGGYGTVFKITPNGTLTTLHRFNSTDGAVPYGGLVLASDGNFYGTTACGGNSNEGTVFEITSGGTVTPLHDFDGTDGFVPYAGLVQSTAGTFYGTTGGGGTSNICNLLGVPGCGTVFSLSLTNQPQITSVSEISAQQYQTIVIMGSGFGTNQSYTGDSSYIALLDTTRSWQAGFTGYESGPWFCGGTGSAYDLVTLIVTSWEDSMITLGGFSGDWGGDGGNWTLNTGDVEHICVWNPQSGNGPATYAVTIGQPTQYTLTVSTSGSGTVTSTDGFINCPAGVCSYSYPPNTPVTLNATPAPGWSFAGWSGACTGTGSCNLTMTQNLSVTANFTQTYLLTVSTNGNGTVTSTDGGISCPGTCGNSYPVNTPVTLNALAAPGWSFAGWGGACSGTGSCSVTMTQNQSVMATFTQNPNNFTLTVSISGSGTVMSTDGHISCPGTCSYTYADNTQVTLNATATQGGTFSGWSGACTGTGSCTVTMTQNLSVTAAFTGQQDMVLHSFGTGNDGQNPYGSLILDSAGNLYGTTSTKGLYGTGTIFRVSPNGSETVLYNFGPANGNDGQNPFGNLIFDSAGNLYGTTSAGGNYGKGTVFELSPYGAETVLYSFGNGADGQNPFAGLTFDTSGNLYGTTVNGGANGGGTAFELSPNGAGGWTETVLYSFGNGSSDGLNPYAGLIFDNSGNLYGTTYRGGAYGYGTVFELLPITANNKCCREIIVYSFGPSADGQNPHAGLIFDSSGNLYGTTVNGGANGGGTAFEVSPNGGGGWAETVLYSFGSNGSSDGLNPYAGLIFDNSGNLYGTTAHGGLYSGGTLSELLPSNAANNKCCREIIVYNFGASATDGQNPQAGLIFDGSGNLYGTTVNGGANNLGTVFGIRPGSLQLVPITPCRLVDTRKAAGGDGPIQGGTFETFNLPQLAQTKGCENLSSAAAYSLNVTVVPEVTLGYLTIWPAGQSQPLVSTVNSYDGRVKAVAAIVPTGVSAAVSVYVTHTTDVILDIDGYFATPGASTLAYYPLPPCRIADTRYPPGDLAGPYLMGGVPRNFPILEATSCFPEGVSPAAYSLNFTAIPHGPLGFLTVWPAGGSQPNVSTLNSYKGVVVANAAIVPAGTSGEISTYASQDTDLVIDIDGYFAPPGQGGLSLYPVVPCRVLDTRLVGNGQPFVAELTVDVLNSTCAPPSSAQAYVLNTTVVPSQILGYLTLWPDGQTQPYVSTLNSYDGAVTSNMAIVPAGQGGSHQGKIDAYATDLTQLILDISSYFGP